MIELRSPGDLSEFIKGHSYEKLRKSMKEYEDLIVIRIHIMNPERYDMAVYRVELERISKPVVAQSVKNSYKGLSIPEMNSKEIEEWNANVPSNMRISKYKPLFSFL